MRISAPRASSTNIVADSHIERSSDARFKILLSIIFFCSGFSALVYQIVWQRVITLYHGMGSHTITLVVSVFMLGLGLGGLLGGMLAQRVRNLIRVYFLIEILIAVIGFSSLPLLTALGKASTGWGSTEQLVMTFCCLLPPTILMGMTLPILTELMVRMRTGFLESLSTLYSVNTFGASVGAIVTAFGLISFAGLDWAVICAACINLLLAVLIFPLARTVPSDSLAPSLTIGQTRQSLKTAAFACVFVTGFIAIACEILWFRTVEILIKASPYAFACVLGVYLFGLASGSVIMNALLKWRKFDLLKLYFGLQIGIGFYLAFSYYSLYALADNVLKPFIDASFHTTLHPSLSLELFQSWQSFQSGWFAYFDFLIWPAYFMLIPTILMGASFPLISFLARSEGQSAGKTTGLIYFCNILGNVIGGVAMGYLLLPILGTATSVVVLFLMSLPFVLLMCKQIDNKQAKLQFSALVLIVYATLLLLFPKGNAFFESIHIMPESGCKTLVSEGRDAVVVTYSKGNKLWNYINGLAHGGRLDYITGYYARAIECLSQCQKAENVLVIGFGTGGIVEAVLKCDEVRKVTVVELSETLIKNMHQIPSCKEILTDPRVELVIDDGRRFLNRNEQKFDAILMDPLRSSTAYSNNLYSRDFFALLKKRLNKGGVVMVWIDNWLELPRTIVSQFPYAKRYDTFCLASTDKMTLSQERKSAILGTFPVVEQNAIEAAENYKGDETMIWQHTVGISANSDYKPRCEYYLGLLLGRRGR